jgi:hypothetical protein
MIEEQQQTATTAMTTTTTTRCHRKIIKKTDKQIAKISPQNLYQESIPIINSINKIIAFEEEESCKWKERKQD